MTGLSIQILTALRNELAAITAANPAPRHPVTVDDHVLQAVKQAHTPDSYGDESYCRTCQHAYPCPTVLIADGRPLTPCTDCYNSHFERGNDLWQEPVVHEACAQAIQPRPTLDAAVPDAVDLQQAAEWIEHLADTAGGDTAELAERPDQDTLEGRELARLRLRVARLERQQADEEQRTTRHTQALNARLNAIRTYAEHDDTPDTVRQHLTALLDAQPATDESWRRDPQYLDVAAAFVKAW
jgi:hypothetical protein